MALLEKIAANWDILVAFGTLILGHFRTGWRVKQLEKERDKDEAAFDKEITKVELDLTKKIEKLEVELKKEIEHMEKERTEDKKVIWNKIDAANDKLTTVLEKLAEIKGSMDASRNN